MSRRKITTTHSKLQACYDTDKYVRFGPRELPDKFANAKSCISAKRNHACAFSKNAHKKNLLSCAVELFSLNHTLKSRLGHIKFCKTGCKKV